jgi:ribosomal protein L12E/L44/L45/RPP1/RPP2
MAAMARREWCASAAISAPERADAEVDEEEEEADEEEDDEEEDDDDEDEEDDNEDVPRLVGGARCDGESSVDDDAATASKPRLRP